MLRVIIFLVAVMLAAAGIGWLADRPGNITINWLGYTIEQVPVVLVIAAFIMLFAASWLVVWLIGLVLGSPGALGGFLRRRRRQRGEEALSRGLVAISSGDAPAARRYAATARRIFSDEPLAKLLDAQAAQLSGDRSRIEQSWRSMLEDAETEIVALRGLFSQAQKDGDTVSARQYAMRAHSRNPDIGWASEAMTLFESADGNWSAVLKLLEDRRKSGTLEREKADRLRAVALTAQALTAQDEDLDAALDLAGKAHKLDPALIPAAILAAKIYAEQGALRKACKVVERTWGLKPHPDLAEIYAHARAGDSPQDRMKRLQELLRLSSGGVEGAIALANAAIDARDWAEARKALKNHVSGRPPVRVCTLMAEIEEGEFGDRGRAREWLARAVRAPRDPAWTADGHTREDWLPVSPVTGELGAFEWKIPLAALDQQTALPEITLAEPEPAPDKDPDEADLPAIPAIAVSSTPTVIMTTPEEPKPEEPEVEVLEAEPVDEAPTENTEMSGEDSDKTAPAQDAGKDRDTPASAGTSAHESKPDDAPASKAENSDQPESGPEPEPAAPRADTAQTPDAKPDQPSSPPARPTVNGHGANGSTRRGTPDKPDVQTMMNRQPDDPGPPEKH